MEILLIAALLASNLFLISRILKAPDKPVQPEPPKPEPPPAAQTVVDSAVPDIVGRSHYDMAEIQAMLDERDAMMRQWVRAEFTKPEDVGLPPDEPESHSPQIPDEKLEETFTHHTVTEANGEKQEAVEPAEAGADFDKLNTMVRVLKDEPHTPEEEKDARHTVAGIHGTAIEEQLSFDPAVRTKILTIMYGPADEPLTKEVIAKKTVAYSKTIDTVGVDRINLNILT